MPRVRYASEGVFETNAVFGHLSDLRMRGWLAHKTTTDGRTRRYRFESECKGPDQVAVTVSTASPKNDKPFGDRDGVGPIREVTGFPPGVRRDIKQRVERLSQYVYDSFAAEQAFLAQHFKNGTDEVSSGKRVTRRSGAWLITERRGDNDAASYSAIFQPAV